MLPTEHVKPFLLHEDPSLVDMPEVRKRSSARSRRRDLGFQSITRLTYHDSRKRRLETRRV